MAYRYSLQGDTLEGWKNVSSKICAGHPSTRIEGSLIKDEEHNVF